MAQNIYFLVPNGTAIQQDFIDTINADLKKTIEQIQQNSYIAETANICIITFAKEAILKLPLRPATDIAEIPEIAKINSYTVNFRKLMTFLEYQRQIENPKKIVSDIAVICINDLIFNTKALIAIAEELSSLKGILAIFIVNVDKNQDCFSLLRDYCTNWLPNAFVDNALTLGDFLLDKEINDIIAIEPNKIYFDGY